MGQSAPSDKPAFLDASDEEDEGEGGYLGADRLAGLGEGEDYDSDAEVYAADEKVGFVYLCGVSRV